MSHLTCGGTQCPAISVPNAPAGCCTASGRCGIEYPTADCSEVVATPAYDRTCDGIIVPAKIVMPFPTQLTGCCLPSGACGAVDDHYGCIDVSALPGRMQADTCILHCSNRKMDADELGVDCGGECPGCEEAGGADPSDASADASRDAAH